MGEQDAAEALSGKGVSKAELSRRFGVSRRTIHEWIETGQLDRDLSSGRTRYAAPPRGPQRLDPYKGMLSPGDRIRAAVQRNRVRLRGSRLKIRVEAMTFLAKAHLGHWNLRKYVSQLDLICAGKIFE